MTIKQCLSWAKNRLKRGIKKEAEQHAQLLLAQVLGVSRAYLLAERGLKISFSKLKIYKKLIQARARHVPLQYLLGREEFMGEIFKVGKGVLIPRPETELLAQAAIRIGWSLPALQWIADLGTGSGVLALTLARVFTSAQIWGMDFSSQALKWAGKNRRNLGIRNVRLMLCDAEQSIPKRLAGKFSLVVSNPPYIPTKQLSRLQAEVRFEPRVALDGGPDGLEGLRRMLQAAARLLQSGGYFISELGIGQAEKAKVLFRASGFTDLQIIPDWQNIPRVLRGCKKEPSSPLMIFPPVQE